MEMTNCECHIIEEDREEASAALAELQQTKQDLKEQLWSHDMAFFKEYGRMPIKKDKERLRHLYEKYKEVKLNIRARTGEARRTTREETGIASPSKDNANDTVTITGSGISSSNDDMLAALRVEMTALHILLRSYEREFFTTNKRKVSSLDDTQPLANQYRRYVAVKREIKRRKEY